MPPLTAHQAIQQALAHQRSGRLDDAQRIYERILQRIPDYPPALHLLGMLLHARGEHQRGLDLIRRTIELAPAVPDFHNNLGTVLGIMGQHEQAAQAFRQAIALNPDFARAHVNLGTSLVHLGRAAQAEQACRAALRVKPRSLDALVLLARALHLQSRFVEAAEVCRQALDVDASCGPAHEALGATLMQLGDQAQGLAHLRQAVQTNPHSSSLHSFFLMSLLHADDVSPQQILDEHLAWAARHALPLHRPAQIHVGSSCENRRLRLGYVSPDFRRSAVATFLESALVARDRKRFEVFCYSDVAAPDDITRRFQRHADHWRDTRRLPDVMLAEVIRRDRIDVLIDPTGHMTGTRLLVFARRPAPVQIAVVGYPATTGSHAIDYVLTDRWQDPPGQTECQYVEKLLRMEVSAHCYCPPDDAPLPGPLPAMQAGHVTFGAFNRMAKITPRTLALWAGVLRAVPGSRLLAKANAPGAPQIRAIFHDAAIPTDRLELVAPCPHDAYWRLYGRVDIALDTFPYAGCTTTCDALWMGVPVISLVGNTSLSRTGLSLLSAVGLSELAVESEEEYARAAAALAGDLPRLQALRAGLRDRMRSSTLANAQAWRPFYEQALCLAWNQRKAEHATT